MGAHFEQLTASAQRGQGQTRFVRVERTSRRLEGA